MYKNKRNSYFIVTSLFLILANSNSYSQTYSYTYRCMVSAVPGDTAKTVTQDQSAKPDSSASGFDQLLELIPIRINTAYDIISDGKYMIVKGRVESATTENFGIKVRPDGDDEVIIDIKRKLIFFSQSKIVRRIKVYSLDSSEVKANECNERVVQEKGAGYTVVLCKNLPSALFPPILFSNINFGIKSVNAPGISIELATYKKIKKDKRLSQCSTYFRKYVISSPDEAFFD